MNHWRHFLFMSKWCPTYIYFPNMWCTVQNNEFDDFWNNWCIKWLCIMKMLIIYYYKNGIDQGVRIQMQYINDENNNLPFRLWIMEWIWKEQLFKNISDCVPFSIIKYMMNIIQVNALLSLLHLLPLLLSLILLHSASLLSLLYS